MDHPYHGILEMETNGNELESAISKRWEILSLYGLGLFQVVKEDGHPTTACKRKHNLLGECLLVFTLHCGVCHSLTLRFVRRNHDVLNQAQPGMVSRKPKN